MAILISLATICLWQSSQAGSATWKQDPTSNDWNTASNWMPETVPNQNTDVATFGVSSVVEVSVAIGFNLDSIVFDSGASAYTFDIAAPSTGSIVFVGGGVTNSSGVTQTFNCLGNIGFVGDSTAGENLVYNNKSIFFGPSMIFNDNSNAGGATFVNAGYSSDFESGAVSFRDTSSAANSNIINLEGNQSGGGFTTFDESSTAANSTITNQVGAFVEFNDLSTAANATLIADGGTISFEQSSSGGLSRIELMNGGILNVANRVATVPMGIGSLKGDGGSVHLGQRQLAIGGNGLSTTYGGTISQSGSVVKRGHETLTLTGKNTYTGGTTVAGGTLIVQATTGSATGTGAVQVNGGTFGGTGIVSGAVTVGNGTSGKALLSPGVKGPGTLTIAKSLTFNSNGSYNFELGLTRSPKADQVAANGVTISSGAKFNLRTKGTQTLASGTSFTVISNTSANPITGTFSNLADGSTIVAGNNSLLVSYSGGDGNDLTLTVVQ